MSIFSQNTISALKQFWITFSGWNEIRSFSKLYFHILKNPFRHTIEVFKKIEPRDCFTFFTQSTIIFTIITSIVMAFRGNDILKSIVLMANQLLFLTLSTLLYYVIFNFISKSKKNFTEFLSLYTLYMGFILPFFAIGLFLQWQIALMITDPINKHSGPNPLKAILIFLGTTGAVGFSIYYSTRVIKYYWNISFGWIAFGLAIVFFLLSPLQKIVTQWQCKLGITPEFEFNSLAHRKATYESLGCEDISCKKCLLIGEWEITNSGILKIKERIYKRELIKNKGIFSFIDNEAIDKEINIIKRDRYLFDETEFTSKSIDTSGNYINSSTPWFISDDGKKIFFNNSYYPLLSLKKDTILLGTISILPDNSTYNDTISLQQVIKNDAANSYKKLLEYLLK